MTTITTITILTFIILLFVGCKSTPEYRETRIIDTVFSISSPIIYDTLTAINYDTVIAADRLSGRDTIIKVRFYPRTNTVTVYAKPDTVRFRYRDTTMVYREAAVKEGSGPWWWLIIIAAVGLYMYLIRRKKA